MDACVFWAPMRPLFDCLLQWGHMQLVFSEPKIMPAQYAFLALTWFWEITRNAPNFKGKSSNSRYSLNLCVHCIRWACSYYFRVFWPGLFCFFSIITSLSWNVSAWVAGIDWPTTQQKRKLSSILCVLFSIFSLMLIINFQIQPYALLISFDLSLAVSEIYHRIH